MNTISKVRGRQHLSQRRVDRLRRVRQEIGDAGERLVGLRVENMQDGANEQGMAGLLPMIAPLERAFGIDQDVCDILRVPTSRSPLRISSSGL